ncbi:MAG: hypothetical protein WD534_05600 [Phycisphaeraceae bacterium]
MALSQHFLHRIKQLYGVTELGSITVLSLATIATAWCGYQSALWGGIQTFALHETDRSERAAAQQEVQVNQLRMVDAALFVQYLTARTRGEEQVAELLRQRFRPEAQVATSAWLATDPDVNPDAPSSPFVMPQYRLAAAKRAEELRAEASDHQITARKANTNSDNYVMLTVLFTTVLFFTGICTKLPSQTMRRATLGIGVLLFVVGLVVLVQFPVAD